MKIGQAVYLWNGDLKTKPIKSKIEKITEKTIRLYDDNTIFRRNYFGYYYNKNGFKIHYSKNEVNEIIVATMLDSLVDNVELIINEDGLSKFSTKISKAHKLISEIVESIEKEENG